MIHVLGNLVGAVENDRLATFNCTWGGLAVGRAMEDVAQLMIQRCLVELGPRSTGGAAAGRVLKPGTWSLGLGWARRLGLARPCP
jgi:hypothetical protein